MLVPRSAALLAGEVLAHAAWSVAEAPEGEVLIPLGGILREGRVELIRFVPEELSGDFIAFARQQLADQQGKLEAWTLAYDTRVTRDEGKVDAIVFEVWGQGMTTPTMFAQPYQPFHSGTFRLLGEPFFLGTATSDAQSALSETLRTFRRGVENHKQVAVLWDNWLKAGASGDLESTRATKPWWRFW
ncbi:MAG: hypothetical protein QOH06_1609 [Acidobacteriota bacterium]|jgi:hypothetical protein|nr:hypothetical protein [Acidobacteriota bacterium]